MVKKIRFGIESLVPMKQDRWLEGKQPKTEKEYIKQAEEKIYTDAKGNIGIPTNAIKATMRLASSEIGKKMEAKKNRQAISAGIFIDGDVLPFNTNKKKPDEIVKDIITRQGVGNKVTRVPTYRPLIKEWKIEGTMNLFEEAGITESLARESLELAGFKFGLLSHRPDFGRFKLTKWEVIK